MIQVRTEIFETNSSSVHSLVICTEDDFNKWESGKLIYDYFADELIEVEKIKKSDDEDDDSYVTYNEFFNGYIEDGYLEYMEKYQKHETINGVDVVAFGYYGHD